MSSVPTPTNAAQWYPQATAQFSPNNQSNLDHSSLVHLVPPNTSPGSSLAAVPCSAGAPTSFAGNVIPTASWPVNTHALGSIAPAATLAGAGAPLGYSVMNMNANSGATAAAATANINMNNNNNNTAAVVPMGGGGALPRYPAGVLVDDSGSCCCPANSSKDVVDDGCGCCGSATTAPGGAGCCGNDPNGMLGGMPPLPDTTSCCLLPGEPMEPYMCTTLCHSNQPSCCDCMYAWFDCTFVLMFIFFVASAVGFGLVVGIQKMDDLFTKFGVDNTVALQASLLPYMRDYSNTSAVCTVSRQLLGAFGTICLEGNLNANVMTVQLSAWNNARDTLWFIALVFTAFALIYAVMISYHRNELRCRLQQQIPPLPPEKQAEMMKLPPAQQHAYLAEYERAAVANAESLSMNNIAQSCCDYVFPIEVYSTPFYEFMRFAWFISGLVVFLWTCNLTVSFWSVSSFYINNTSGPLRDFWSGFQKKFTATVVVVTIYLAWPFLLFFVELLVWLVLLLPWLLIRCSCKVGIGYYRPALPPHKLPGWIRIDMFFMDLQDVRRLGFSWLSWILLTGSDRPFFDCCIDPTVDRDPAMTALRQQHELWQQHLNMMRSIWAMKPGTEMWQRMSYGNNAVMMMNNNNNNNNNIGGNMNANNGSASMMAAAMMMQGGYGGSTMQPGAMGGINPNMNVSNLAMQQMLMGQNGSLPVNPSVPSGTDPNAVSPALPAAGGGPAAIALMGNNNSDVSGATGGMSTNPHTPMDEAGGMVNGAAHHRNQNNSREHNSDTPETRHRQRRHHNRRSSESKEHKHHPRHSPSKEKMSLAPTAAVPADGPVLQLSPNMSMLGVAPGHSPGDINHTNNNMYTNDAHARASSRSPGSRERHSRSRHRHHRHRDESSRHRDRNKDRNIQELDALMDL